MINKIILFRFCAALLFCFIQLAGINVSAQRRTEPTDSLTTLPKALMKRINPEELNVDSIISANDSVIGLTRELIEEAVSTQLEGDTLAVRNDSIIIMEGSSEADSIARLNRENLEKLAGPIEIDENDGIIYNVDSVFTDSTPRYDWKPSSNRSLWLATVIPGGGQIYNRKYWKLPIIYGGFVGCMYALTWNNQMYKDYTQAYQDLMDDDPNTNSYLDFFPPGYDVEGNMDRWTTTFKNRKDMYRRYRDLSIFAFIGVYLISVIDAYVDAELSSFDISPDLSFRVEPTFMNHTPGSKPVFGLQCSIKF